MTDDTTIIPFRQPGSIIDPLTEIARDGARRMLMAALKAEADGFVARFSEDLLADGHQRIVRHGAGPERVIQTGIGPIEVRRQKVRDRATDVPVEARVRFTSNILPKWARPVVFIAAPFIGLPLSACRTSGRRVQPSASTACRMRTAASSAPSRSWTSQPTIFRLKMSTIR